MDKAVNSGQFVSYSDLIRKIVEKNLKELLQECSTRIK